MLFHSFTYLVFLALVTVLFWCSGRTTRLWLLFGAGIVFYGFWRWEYVFFMLATLTLDYVVAQKIAAQSCPRRKKRWLLTSLIFNLGLLFYFKYTLFILGEINGILSLMGAQAISLPWTILLPIGISFYTFQSIGYVVDVYRGYKKPVREYALYGAFVTFFPQLIAGPILRAQEVVPQLESRPTFSTSNLALGMRMILSGLFLKVVLADHIAPFVDTAFATPVETLSALDVWVMAFLFGFQIYFDFSAYSMIAIGSAKLMGIHFPANFNFPYLATSPRDFWKRWHISLSSWIRDYIYLPLAGIRPRDESVDGLSATADDKNVPKARLLFALVATWFIMGLWHGASWTFAAWGLWHAALIIGYRFCSRLVTTPRQVWKLLGWFITLPIMMLGWLFFRAASLPDALSMLRYVVQPSAYLNTDKLSSGYIWQSLPIHIDPLAYALAAALTLGVIVCWWFKFYVWDGMGSIRIKQTLLVVFVAFETFFVFTFLQASGQFIYFQF